MKTLLAGVGAIVVFAAGGLALPGATAARDQSTSQTSKKPPAQPAPKADELDRLFAPIALYPDPLLAQMLMSAENPAKIAAAFSSSCGVITENVFGMPGRLTTTSPMKR